MMYILTNVLLITTYLVSVIALIYLVHLMNKDSKALHEAYRDYLTSKDKK